MSTSADSHLTSAWARAAELALLAAHEILHHADAAHRHAVGRDAPLVGTLDGRVLDADDELRIGVLSGGEGHGGAGFGGGTLGGELRRARFRESQRLVERERGSRVDGGGQGKRGDERATLGQAGAWDLRKR
jgi:hypothetical protein